MFRRIKPEDISTPELILMAYLSQGVFFLINTILAVLLFTDYFCAQPWCLQLRAELIERGLSWQSEMIAIGSLLAVALLLFVELTSYTTLRILDRIPGFQDFFVVERWKDRLRLAPAGILAGLNEEVLFRGFIFSFVMIRWPEGPWGSNEWLWIIFISIAFGILHGYQGVSAIFVTSFFGIIMFLLLLWTESLIAPIICHATYDVLAFLLNADPPSTKLSKELEEEQKEIDRKS